MKVGRVVGAADERPGSDVVETFRARDLAVSLESLRRDERDDRQMLRARPQVLAHRQNLAPDLAQVVHGLEKFRLFFAEAKHHSAFGHDLRRQLFGLAKNIKRRSIFRARTDERRQPFHGFHVVIEDIGRCVENDLDAPGLRVKIGHEYLDDHRRIHFPDRADRAREMIRAAVFQIIARDRGDDDVLQSHPAHGLGDTLRFVFLQGKRLGGSHRAKPAGAGATFARDHHCRRSLAPAFPAVRALRALAHRVQPQIGDERLGRKENRVRRQPHFDPGRLLRLVQRRIDFHAGHEGRKSDM
jgi:hypothetical protein